MDFEGPGIVPAHQLLTSLVNVIPARAAADTERMTDRRCHVAPAVNRQVSARAVLRDQRTDEALITAMYGAVAEVARYANRCWCRVSELQDRSAPMITEEDGHGSTTP